MGEPGAQALVHRLGAGGPDGDAGAGGSECPRGAPGAGALTAGAGPEPQQLGAAAAAALAGHPSHPVRTLLTNHHEERIPPCAVP